MVHHTTPHPAAFIDLHSSQVIRERSSEAEELGELHRAQLDIAYAQGWFNMLVPKEFGGRALALPAALKIEEGLSYADGSTAWVVTLCSGAAWFAGFIQPSLLGEVFDKQNVCFAGSGAATGTAKVTTSGFEISGQWKYASGCLHASVFTANCVIEQDGVNQLNADGSPRIRPFLFFADEVTLHHTWHSMGMIATGSHSFAVKGLNVPSNRCFVIDGKFAIAKDPLYQYPFLQLAETTLTINLSGMAMRFLDLCAPLFSARMQRSHPVPALDLVQKLAASRAELNVCRSDFYAAVEKSWRICVNGDVINSDVFRQVSKACYTLAGISRKVVDELYPFCGLLAADTRHEINRVWRNIHTAGQHALFTSG